MQYYNALPYYNGLYHPSYGYINAFGGYQHFLPSPPPSPQMTFSFADLIGKSCPKPAQNQFVPATCNTAVNLTLQPPPKRRRLSSQSSVSSISSQSTLPDVSKLTATPAISNASFIQQTFTPLTADIASIDNETLNRLMPYNQNMVRKFPKKERTAKEQERRDKNTIACRISRCREKIKLATMEQQYAIFKKRNTEVNREIIPMAAYLNELIRYGVAFKPDARNEIAMALGKTLKYKFLAKLPIQKSTKRNFSIAFLLGLE